MTTYLFTFISVIIVSLVSFIGVFFLSLREDILNRYTHALIGLAVGALLGDAFIHIIPEISEKLPNSTLASLLLIIGILLFFTVEKFLHWHHHKDDCEINHPKPVGELVLLTDGLHNLIDGVIIGVSFLTSVPIGIATTLAVILHEIPQEIGDFAVLIHSGFSKKKALLLNFLSALTAVLGAFLALIFGRVAESSTLWILPIAAGGFIYIAVADLIPELHKERSGKGSLLQIVSVFLGVLMMLALLWIE